MEQYIVLKTKKNLVKSQKMVTKYVKSKSLQPEEVNSDNNYFMGRNRE